MARDVGLCLGLLALVALAFARVLSFGFTGLDDPAYVASNPHVLGGLTQDAVRWAFTTFETSNWHPLTWLSLQADATLGGAHPAVYHGTNVILHAGATLLLFLFLRCATGFALRSAMVAALFAVHPLHVESVAWIAERKDVLSALLFFLTLLAYLGYVRRPGPGRLAAVTGVYLLGLLAKPMLVSLPLVLLLLDAWPLGRWDLRRSWLPPWALVREKLALAALAAASCVLTLIAQSAGGAVVSLQRAPLAPRAANALVSVVVYLGKTIWPADLAVLYPFPPHGTPVWQALGAAVLVAVLTWIAVRAAKRPYLLVGWLWYLVMLVPVMGLVQVGLQGRADRYTYLPLVGIFMAGTWAIAERLGRRVGMALAVLVLAALLPVCVAQVKHWESQLTLFQRLVDVEPDYPAAHLSLGVEQDARGDRAGARRSFTRALELDPGSADAHANLAFLALREGDLDQALAHGDAVVRLEPQLFEGHLARGQALAGLKRHQEAIESFTRTLALSPGQREARAGLGSELLWTGRTEEALQVLRQAVGDAPGDARLRHDLAVALLRAVRL
ncbi:MAG TPA: tetratricopeptide repeat protein, partial [Candidatus Polarisedimenticolaceae bacterium]|nr:tetratricopeptide repeat protein [Candidatus Polarisedimenticolaceae bacterium]